MSKVVRKVIKTVVILKTVDRFYNESEESRSNQSQKVKIHAVKFTVVKCVLL